MAVGPLKPIVLVIFGAGGDLTWRKLVPALYNLRLDHWLPERFAVVGVDKREFAPEAFLGHLREGVDQFSFRGQTQEEEWKTLSACFSYLSGDFDNPATFAEIGTRIAGLEKDWGEKACRVYYLAIPPGLIETIVGHLGADQLVEGSHTSRIVVEKPFGHDLSSAHALNIALGKVFDESAIYRIDHFLAKETVQNLLAFRFANALFEPIWDRRYIDHVQITVAEEVGVAHRGAYYDKAGALRDMIQNHLMQLLCLIAMEPMVSFDADEIRNKKVDVLRAIRPIPEDLVHEYAVRGQYGAGWLHGEHVVAYRDEPTVAKNSSAETFAAVKFFVDNWRWQKVPFYLRTGKRLPVRASEISIEFRPVPHQSFPASAALDWRPNRLIIHIQPHEGIVLHFQAKHPGQAMRLSPVGMAFTYQDAFKTAPPQAYETLLLDVMRGDATLFMRAEQAEAAWAALMPVLNVWGAVPPADFPNYPAGTWGPEDAAALTARDGRSWVHPPMETA